MAEKHLRLQTAALPYVVDEQGVRVLLVTSRETSRWIIPKGWLERKIKPCDQAAREAFEEAGVTGTIGRKPFGSFRYGKRLRNRTVTCAVDVYLLRVEREYEDWPERGQRLKRWLSPEAAAGMVDEAELAAMVLRLQVPGPGLAS
jgi:8-oxo-dGTP pyrophosphatase MutT (NUDIX family)